MTAIENQMSLGLGDLGNDSSQELQGIDALLVGWQLIGLVVVNAFGSVENLRVCWIPLHSGKTHRGTKHVAGDLFESFSFARRNSDGIVDAESTSVPRE